MLLYFIILATNVRALLLVAKGALFPCNNRALFARCATRHVQSVFNLIVDIHVMVN